ncbi:recombinase family protein [Deinococcus alpinitundrae]|uniref:recombinase family protein n=1 Tax=Deinococcus alpinitundrae TaxID=468913 RepID=UPI00137AA886|nr:recombinase family protein [Deinococcus alpinitundrae]
MGLEAQQAAVLSDARGKDLALALEFTEIETGTRKRRRPQPETALEQTRRIGGVLLIAQLDRLARNVAVVATLMESGVRFVAVDMPEADNFTIHVMAAVAEREAQLISARTKAALGARKARGLKLGKPENLTLEHRLAGPASSKARAVHDRRTVAAYAGSLRRQGLRLRAVAGQREAHGFKTRQGGFWNAVQVKRVLDRQKLSSLDSVHKFDIG